MVSSYQKHPINHKSHGYRRHPSFKHPWGRDLEEEDYENVESKPESDEDEDVLEDKEEPEEEPEPCEDGNDDVVSDTTADLVSQDNDRQIMSSASFFCRGFFNTQFCGIFGL